MTPKEAIEKIEAHVNCYSGDKVDYAPYFQSVKQALTELEKKDKLLKLYRLSQKWIFAVSAEWKELDKQIKELEEELKK